MKYLWFLTLLAIIATAVLSLCGAGSLWCAVAAIFAVILMIWLWIATVAPIKKAAIGIELIQAEEYNNRLAPSRVPGANRIVKVFNNLMDKLSEERLKLMETNNLLQLLVKSSPMGVAIMDFDNIFTLVNEAFINMSGVDEESLLGHTAADFKTPLLKSISHLGDGEESIIKTADTEIYRITRLSFMEKGFKRPFILIEKLTDEIRRAEKDAYGKVVRTISHEVNNSMGGLRSFLETLTEIDDLDDDLRELADSCIEGCGELVEFIKGYADVVRIGDPVLHRVDYNEVVTKELPFLRSILPSDIILETHLCDSPLYIDIDRAMMHRMLVNIVKNAGESIAEAGRTDGKITITTDVSAKNWSVEIEDNGKGITDEQSGLLFTPFHTTKKNGQGLGLTLSSEILHRHNFKFSLRTITPDRTIFKITAPQTQSPRQNPNQD